MGLGISLRAARERSKLTLREVQERSSALARKHGDRDLCLSSSWLARIEAGSAGISATKLVGLAAIYGCSIDEMVALALGPGKIGGADVNDLTSLPNATLLLTRGPLLAQAEALIPDASLQVTTPDETYLLERNGDAASRLRRGIVGRKDNTMAPMLQPGSVVVIDTQIKSIAKRREWTHEFDRPIYFLMTREGYRTGFCELDAKGEWLTLVPHALSYQSNRRWLYRHDVDMIGEVVSFTSRRRDCL